MASFDDPYRLAVLKATRYYRLGLFARLGLVVALALTLISVLLVGLMLVNPLYTFEGPLVTGEIGLLSYRLLNYGKPVRAPPLDSITRLSFALVIGAALSAALTLPTLWVVFKRRVPRVLLEAAAAGYVIAGLTIALLISFLRILYFDIIPSIPLGGSVNTPYGSLVLYESSGWYTDIGLLSLKLWNYFPVMTALLIVAAAVLLDYIVRYYEDILERPAVPAHTS